MLWQTRAYYLRITDREEWPNMLEEDKKGILLESGTNEIEVMEFTIDGSLYGINVAKVKKFWFPLRLSPCPTHTLRWRGFSSRGTS